ncbi:hypothetical protein SY2F82_35760 [Streptomyces sp. Y2F8-2]|nr:hypothetical protein SY2F82_35760 [Streptomyces sp. Y2F8-2]
MSHGLSALTAGLAARTGASAAEKDGHAQWRPLILPSPRRNALSGEDFLNCASHRRTARVLQGCCLSASASSVTRAHLRIP